MAEVAMAVVEESIEVEVPVEIAYDQWTRITDYPMFLEGVRHVESRDADRSRWTTYGGHTAEEFDVTVTERQPVRSFGWSRTDGREAALVTLEPVAETRSAVTLRLSHEPDTVAATAADALGALRHRAKRDLRRFKELIEQYRAGDAPAE